MAALEPTLEKLELVQDDVLSVSPAAQQMIKTLLEQRSIPDHALRVFVSGGGCSGLQYGMSFEQSSRDFDTIIDVNGVRLLIDPASLMYLQGASIDFIDSPMGGGFRIDNPNAESNSGCGCGGGGGSCGCGGHSNDGTEASSGCSCGSH
ncbi:MAG: iron-sulfur cluster assembly accessory protein [Anaerolineae bacterium]|nr:iron-sulfur cluster assembly accessory protein [Anaerolineae bacterium]